MNSKSRYELAASVCRGKVWLDNTALAAISRMYRKRIENATSKLEATVEQGRYASFRIDQALDHHNAPSSVPRSAAKAPPPGSTSESVFAPCAP